MANIPIVSMRNVSKSKGVFRLRKVLLQDMHADFFRGEHYALLADRGSGSAAFLSLLAGTSRPSTGRIIRTGIVSQPVSAVTQVASYKTGRELAVFLSRLYRADASEVLRFAQDFSGLTLDTIRSPIGSLTLEERLRWSVSLGYALPADIYLFYEDIQYGPEDFRVRCREAYAARCRSAGTIIALSNVRRASELAQKGCVLFEKKLHVFDDIEDAIRMFHRTKIAANENTHVHIRTLIQRGEAHQAELYLRGLVSQSEGSPEAHAALAELAFRDGRFPEAISAAEMALRRGGQSLRMFIVIARSMEASENFDGLVQYIERVGVELGAIPPELGPFLASAFEKLGDAQKAGEVWKGLAFSTGSPVAFRKAQTNWQKAQDWSGLLELADWALRSKPDDAGLLELQCQAFVGQKRWDSAEETILRLSHLNTPKAIAQIYNIARTDHWREVIPMLHAFPPWLLRAQRSERSTIFLSKILARHAFYARKAGTLEEAETIEAAVHLLTLEVDQVVV